jgi:hypothetical protein
LFLKIDNFSLQMAYVSPILQRRRKIPKIKTFRLPIKHRMQKISLIRPSNLEKFPPLYLHLFRFIRFRARSRDSDYRILSNLFSQVILHAWHVKSDYRDRFQRISSFWPFASFSCSSSPSASSSSMSTRLSNSKTS